MIHQLLKLLGHVQRTLPKFQSNDIAFLQTTAHSLPHGSQRVPSCPFNMSTAQPEEASTTAASLPPEAIALAGRMYDAARQGNAELLQQAITAGLPPNLTNEKGDTLVRACIVTTSQPAICSQRRRILLQALTDARPVVIAHARRLPRPRGLGEVPDTARGGSQQAE